MNFQQIINQRNLVSGLSFVVGVWIGWMVMREFTDGYCVVVKVQEPIGKEKIYKNDQACYTFRKETVDCVSSNI